MKLADAIIRILLARDEHRALGAAARAEVEARFSSELTTSAYSSLYQKARGES